MEYTGLLGRLGLGSVFESLLTPRPTPPTGTSQTSKVDHYLLHNPATTYSDQIDSLQRSKTLRANRPPIVYVCLSLFPSLRPSAHPLCHAELTPQYVHRSTHSTFELCYRKKVTHPVSAFISRSHHEHGGHENFWPLEGPPPTVVQRSPSPWWGGVCCRLPRS